MWPMDHWPWVPRTSRLVLGLLWDFAVQSEYTLQRQSVEQAELEIADPQLKGTIGLCSRRST